MSAVEPITFSPIYMERVWGGRELERVYGRDLPSPDRPYGESWEIVDRVDSQSIVDSGPLAGASLHELWTSRREEIFGEGMPDSFRFPVLLKILDAREDLSIQVHPPAAIAGELGGEPKTEMWYIAGCEPGAKLYAGLKAGVTWGSFGQAIADGSVADQVHVVSPSRGDSVWIPSGRLHAIGAGFLIHEIQQNSDTTYRAFDWNRTGLDGKPRELHIAESLASIDFDDHEPELTKTREGVLADCPFFKTEHLAVAAGRAVPNETDERFSILSIVGGSLKSAGGRLLGKGSTLLLPRGGQPLIAAEDAEVLRITLPV